MSNNFYNVREFITIQRNIINIRSKDIYLPITPLSFTSIKIFNHSEHEFILHNNSKVDLIYSAFHGPKEGMTTCMIPKNRLVEITYFFNTETKKGKWNLIMN